MIFQKQVESLGVSVGKLKLEKSPEVPLITSGEAHAAKNKQTNKQTSIAAIAGSHICHICQLSWIMRESPGYSFCVTCSKFQNHLASYACITVSGFIFLRGARCSLQTKRREFLPCYSYISESLIG